MIVGATDVGATAGPSYVVAIDLAASTTTPLWAVKVDNGGNSPAPGQYPIVLDGEGGDPRVVFTTQYAGARAIGVMP